MKPSDHDLLEAWLAEEAAPFTGWDFSHLAGRWTETPVPWSYSDRARSALTASRRVLDMGTGGGERLLELRDLWPASVTVTEEYPPNHDLVTRRLGPLGVRVVACGLSRTGALPLADGEFDLVLNRHSGFNPSEVSRILVPGGVFLTQQVHGLMLADLLAEFGAEPKWPDAVPGSYVPELQRAGLKVTVCEEFRGERVFGDVGALVYYLKAVPWMVDGFSVARFADTLLRLHRRREAGGRLAYADRYYYLEAVKG